ncbi:MAG: extracellular solute-binding protein, partial [Pseudomonadota bacterium]|nr:extracellular solute-binding protein [Pseudomonadota bacterium]
NLARKPQGNDRSQVKAIKEGLCDISLGNSYYLGKMLNTEEQIPWAESVVINFPGQEANGTHMNLSGVAMAKYAPHPEEALALIEFLTEDQAQHIYAELNYEYPVKEGVELSELVQSWGEFKADDIPLSAIASHKQQALKLIDEVQIDF